MAEVGPLMQSGKIDEAEKLIDQAIAAAQSGKKVSQASSMPSGQPGQPGQPSASLGQKVQGLHEHLQAWISSGGDTSKIGPLVQRLQSLMQAGNQVEAEKVVDEILAIVAPAEPKDSARATVRKKETPVKEEEAAALDQVQADLPAALREANWIWCQGEAVPENFYLYCRKSVTFDDMPAHATVHVTADSRYKFFINGQFVGRGPARCDQRYEYYDTFDVAPLLQPGENVISAIVHQYGSSSHSYTLGRGGLLLGAEFQWDDGRTQTVCTDDTWRLLPALTWKRPTPRVCIAIMWVEEYDARKEIAGWQMPGFDDGDWQKPVLLGKPPVAPWIRLVPRNIPPLLEREEFPAAVIDQGTVGKGMQKAVVQFADAIGDTPGKVAYTRAWIHSPVDQRVGLMINAGGFGAPLLVWFNGAPLDQHGPGGARECVLRAGSNELLIKSLCMPGSSDLGLSLLPLPGVTYTPVTWHADKDQASPANTVSVAGPFGSPPEQGQRPEQIMGQLFGRPYPPEKGENVDWKSVKLKWADEDNVALRMQHEPLFPGKTAGLKDADKMLHNGDGLAVVSTKDAGGDVYAVIDFGQEISGYVRLRLDGVAGGIVDLGYSEVFEKGRLDFLRESSWYFADRYIMKDGPQEWELFFWKGFRYLQLDFRNCTKPVRVESVSLNFTSYPVENRGAFECSDELLNRIWTTGRHTLQLCMHDGYEDTPWREQGQWLGDAQIEILSNYYAFGDLKLSAKCLRQFAEGQTKSGLVPANWPADVAMWPEPQEHPFGIPTFMCQWVTMILDNDRYAGQRDLTKTLYPHVLRLMDYFKNYENADGLLENMPGFAFLDWMPDPAMMGSAMPGGAADGILTGMNCHYRRALVDGAAIAALLGDDSHKTEWLAKADRIKKQINDRFWDGEHGAYIHSIRDGRPMPRLAVHDSVLAIYADIATKDRASLSLDRLFGDAPIDAVAIGSPFFYHFYLEALRKVGRHDQAIADTRRDYGKMLDAGATTWWENFHGRDSRSHAWSCGPSYDLPAYVLGVEPTEPAFAAFRVAPEPSDLTWAKGTVPTPQGDVKVEWQRHDDSFTLEVNVPMRSQIELSVPARDLATAKLDGPRPAQRSEFRDGRATPLGRRSRTFQPDHDDRDGCNIHRVPNPTGAGFPTESPTSGRSIFCFAGPVHR